MSALKKIRLVLCMIASAAVMLTSSCQKKSNENPDPGTIDWDCSEISEDAEINLNELFGKSRILGLEETDESLIGSATKLIRNDSLIIIGDGYSTNCIYLFNASNGKFIKKFGETGAGPGEYITLDDVTLNDEDGEIYVLTNKMKIQIYDLAGNLKEEKTLPFRAYRMEYNNGHFYFMNANVIEGEVIVTDKDFNNKKHYLPNENDDFVVICWNPFGKSDDGSVTYYRSFDDNIYNICGTDTITVKYHVDFGEHVANRETLKGLLVCDEHMNQNYRKVMSTRVGDIRNFLENDDFALIYFQANGKPSISFYDKRSGKVHTALVENLVDSITGPMEYPAFECSNGILMQRLRDMDPSVVSRRVNQEVNCGENPLIYDL